VARWGGVGGPGGQVGHRAVRGVVVSPFEPHLAQGGVAHGDADGEAEVVPEGLPALGYHSHVLTHGYAEPDGARGRIRTRNGVVEEDHEAVAGEATAPGPAPVHDRP